MYPYHEECTATVAADPDAVFRYLDDQTRLSAHMNERSWKLGWGKMQVRLDERGGRAVGSHIILEGRVFGVHLYLEEVVTERTPPIHKRWRTIGEPYLLVVGRYVMGFDVSAVGSGAALRVVIDYERPTRGLSRLLGRLFGRVYARWCTRRMVRDAEATFAGQAKPTMR